jgi:hypothetical protein
LANPLSSRACSSGDHRTASPGSWRSAATVLASTPCCCDGAGTGEGMWRCGPPRDPEGSAFAPIAQPADAASSDVPRGQLRNPTRKKTNPLFGGEIGVRTDGDGCEVWERPAASQGWEEIGFFIWKFAAKIRWTIFLRGKI